MKKIAFIFPGQGAQFVGMGRDFYDNFEESKRVFNQANVILGKSITNLCFNGPEESLKQTINTQPAIVTMSIAILEALKSELNLIPNYTAGHSLGEYCAMYSAGVMDLEHTLKAIQERAKLMYQASVNYKGAMCAIINPPSDNIVKECLEKVCNDSCGLVSVANYNSPSQIVLTGDFDAVDRAGDLLKESGAKKVLLPVSGAFHSKIMMSAGEGFADFIEKFHLNNASIPVITNVDAKITMNSEDFREKMPKQIYSSVYWTQTIQKMVTEGVDTFIEIGPGKVLAGLNRKIVPNLTTYSIYDIESLTNTINLLKNEFVEI